ncbi:MAG: NAD(P)-dependent oxidoreductase [Planctomycetes bacterium]|nr:NAD(P)-dependent oxidoreductase [Planctomycetota bacterium]
MIYPSSISVIGETGGGIVDENIREKPLDIYSANKGVAEKYCRIFNKVHDLKTVVLRFGNLYGPYGKKDSALGFLNYFINLAADGENIKIFVEGSQTKNVMFIDDAVDISWQAAHEPKLFGETFFATHQDYHTIKKIAEAIVKEFGNSKIEYVSWPKIRKRIETKNVKFSSAKLHSLIDWQPKYSLAEGLKLTKERMGK